MGSCPSKNQPKKRTRRITIRPIRTTSVDDQASTLLDNAVVEAETSESSASVKASRGEDEGTSGNTFGVLEAVAMATEKQYERRRRLSNVDCVEVPFRSGRRRSFLLSPDLTDEVVTPDESIGSHGCEKEKCETLPKALTVVSSKSEVHSKTLGRSPDVHCSGRDVTSGSRRTHRRSSSLPARPESSGEIKEFAVVSEGVNLSNATTAKLERHAISARNESSFVDLSMDRHFRQRHVQFGATRTNTKNSSEDSSIWT